MALYTGTLAIDQTKEYDIICHSPCTRIVVQENYDSGHAPTDDLLQRGSDYTSSAQIRVAKGTPAIYTRETPGIPGVTKFGTVQAATGSVTLQVVESKQI